MDNIDSLINRFSGYSETYKFYDGQIELVYDEPNHKYLLVEGESLTEVPSVTTIVKKCVDKSEILIPWGAKMMGQKMLSLAPPFPTSTQELTNLINRCKGAHKEILEDAGNVGTMAHNWIEQYIKNILRGDVTYSTPEELFNDERVIKACNAALDWMKAHNVRWKCTEKKIYNRIHKYAGTMDGLAITDSCNDKLCCPKEFKNRLSLIDWKTSNDLYLDYLFQIGAYWGAYVLMESVDNPHGPLVEDGWVIRLGKQDGEFDPWHVWDYDEFEMYYYGFLCAQRWYISMGHAADQVKLKNETLREARKEQRRLLREAQLKLKCSYADKYKGVRKPNCGCETCINKWNELHPLDKLEANMVV